ncbi:hypothetical protein BWQ96_00683 [Gracilariopsis chorda]|uniref:Uncharacterized protein n=1 Tax=Gracilariopsis chorda TaxID=448386 RepID=A0A2V3J5M6_9FLOR|nr:hypothetical protein BWQ96_00683 [Gracilariopsis chorda]|eukprot:PXF49613.1 hypothetical protein BWQ96_00683 [Gracilariopsis chorda]
MKVDSTFSVVTKASVLAYHWSHGLGAIESKLGMFTGDEERDVDQHNGEYDLDICHVRDHASQY